MVEIKMDNDQTNQLLQAAILQTLGEKGQEMIIKEVVRYMTTSSSNNYGASTPLQDHIRSVGRDIAEKILRQKMESDPEFVAQIEEIYIQAFRKVFSTEGREELINRMATQMSAALTTRY